MKRTFIIISIIFVSVSLGFLFFCKSVRAADIYVFTKNLEFEDEDPEVKEIQKFLNSNGFPIASSGVGSPGRETEYFGKKTEEALIKFQNYYKSEVLTPVGLRSGTGYFGPSTRNKFNSINAEKKKVADAAKAAEEAKKALFNNNLDVVLAKSSGTPLLNPPTGKTVAQILDELSGEEEKEQYVVEDTLILPIVSTQTPVNKAIATSEAISKNFSKTLNSGMSDPEVKLLQKFLNDQGFKIASSGAGSPGKETEYFGEMTKQALMKFQEAHKKEILEPFGFSSATGIWGPSSIEFANSILENKLI